MFFKCSLLRHTDVGSCVVVGNCVYLYARNVSAHLMHILYLAQYPKSCSGGCGAGVSGGGPRRPNLTLPSSKSVSNMPMTSLSLGSQERSLTEFSLDDSTVTEAVEDSEVLLVRRHVYHLEVACLPGTSVCPRVYPAL